MDVRRLKDTLDAVVADRDQQSIIELLNALVTAFTQSIQAPSTETAEAFVSAHTALDAATKAGLCATLAPSRLAILSQLGASDLCGIGLSRAIDRTLSHYTTPAQAASDLQQLRARLKAFYQTVATLRDSLDALHVEAEQPPTDAAEVEVRLPFEIFKGSLEGFSKESKRLDRALSDLVEVVTGSRPPLRIRSFGSGSVEIFLVIDPKTGAEIVTLVTAILTLISTVLQTRATRTTLEAQSAPKEVLQPIEAWEKQRVQDELEKLKGKLLERVKDKHRRNELDKALADSLAYLADRIDHGMDVDVSTRVPEADGAADENGRTEAQKLILEYSKQRALRESREAPILCLPLQEEDQSDGEPRKATKTKTGE